MKKTFILIVFILCIYCIIGYKFSNIKIPDNSIRIRILANSNSISDQNIKNEVKSELEPYLYNLLKDIRNINKAREIINLNLNSIDNITSSILKKYNMNYSINYGKNYFPKKEYKGIKYDEGEYESLLITIGNGLGNNWWCVLFPPLCLLEAEESDNVEYTTLVGELLKKYNT